MPVPSTLADLSTTAASNYPTGSEPVGTNIDDYIRAHASFIAQLNLSKSPTVSSITELRALLKTGAPFAFVSGYYSAGDGGGGSYYYDSSDTTSADNGGTIIVGTDGGRWKLVVTDTISVKQFGATGDGVTDDTTALLAAKTSAAGGVLIIPSGIYGISAQIPFSNTITIFADGAVFKWIGSAPGSMTPMVKVGDAASTSEANCPRLGIYGLTLDGNNASNVEGFYFTTTRYGHFEKLRAVNMTSADAFAYTLSGDDTHGLNCADNIFVDLTSEFTYHTMVLKGTNGGFATNNTFYKVYGSFLSSDGLVFTNNCDTNFFYGVHLGANVGVSNFTGVVFNNGTSNTTQDNGVTDIVIDGLIVTGDSGTTYGAVLYQCENIIIRGMRLSAASGTLSNFSRQTVSSPQTYSVEVLTGNGPTPITYRHGKAVSASAGASAGTSPPAPVVASGTYSQAGNITFGTGSGATTGIVLTVTFPSQLDKVPKAVAITPLNGVTCDLKLVPSSVSESGFSLFSVVAPASSQPNTTYSFYYKVEV